MSCYEHTNTKLTKLSLIKFCNTSRDSCILSQNTNFSDFKPAAIIFLSITLHTHPRHETEE